MPFIGPWCLVVKRIRRAQYSMANAWFSFVVVMNEEHDPSAPVETSSALSVGLKAMELPEH